MRYACLKSDRTKLVGFLLCEAERTVSYEKEDDPRGEHSSGTQEPTLYGRRAQEQI
jgi:hypothetical protein